jgi:hypothetical protein
MEDGMKRLLNTKLKRGWTVKTYIEQCIKHRGIDHAFCPDCDDCLPPTLMLNFDIWKKKFGDYYAGLYCPKCMAKRLGGITQDKLERHPGNWYPVKTASMANIVMFLDERTQFLIRKYLKIRRKELKV